MLLLSWVVAACGGAGEDLSPTDLHGAEAAPDVDGSGASLDGDAPDDGASTAIGEGVVVTDRGAVRGSVDGATWAFKAIPYAAPPVGARRWARPVPAEAWTGVRDATTWGPACPQLRKDGTGEYLGDEDCLQLNVWVPKDLRPARPVMVWFHGGGHQIGSATEENAGVRIYDGARLAERAGVVVVTLNYRLGALGFLAHPTLAARDPDRSSGAYGNLDQIEALRWVQRNAPAFGGDPTRVTIFGESAGGVGVCTIVASPLAKGLFSRAIMQSGACATKTKAEAEALGSDVFAAAGCASSADPAGCMQALSSQAVVSALPVRLDVAGGSRAYSASVDGYVLPRGSAELIAAGEHSKVPWIIGSTSDETSRSVALPRTATVAQYEAAVRASFPLLAARVLEQYPASAYPSPWHAYVQLTSDAKFVCQARQALERAEGAPRFRYSLGRPISTPTLEPFGAWHGVDVLFVFGRLEIAGYRPNDGDRRLVDAIQGAWGRFAETGDPSGAFDWPRWTSADEYVDLNDPVTTRSGLRTAQCDFWARLDPARR
jgi:para-nitrobenzyl esterase